MVVVEAKVRKRFRRVKGAWWVSGREDWGEG